MIETIIYLQFLKIFERSDDFIMELQTNFIQFRPFHQSHANAIWVIGGRRKIIFLILSCKKVVEVG